MKSTEYAEADASPTVESNEEQEGKSEVENEGENESSDEQAEKEKNEDNLDRQIEEEAEKEVSLPQIQELTHLKLRMEKRNQKGNRRILSVGRRKWKESKKRGGREK